MLIAAIVDKVNRPNGWQLLSLCLGFAGVVLCVYEEGSLSNASPMGAILVSLACLMGVLAYFCVKPLSEQANILPVTGASLSMGGLLLMLISPQEIPHSFSRGEVDLLSSTLMLSVVSAIGFSLWYKLVTMYDVVRMSAYRLLIPVCGFAQSLLFLSERKPELKFLLGALMVLLALMFIEWQKKRSSSKSSS